MSSPRIDVVDGTLALLTAAIAGPNELGALLGASVAEGWEGFPEALPVLRSSYDANPEGHAWGSLFFVLPEVRTLVGFGGFKGPPTPAGVVEIGYAIAKAFQGRGLATEAVALMLRRAFASPSVHAVDAHTLGFANPSTRVLEKALFKKIGELNDPDDGVIWHWRRERASVAGLPERVAELEARVSKTPSSSHLREELISAYLGEGLAESPARLQHILSYVRDHPTNAFARCPLSQFPRAVDPETFDALEAIWREHVAANPDDVRMTLGLAGLVAGDERSRAIAILREFVQAHPNEPEAWVDLGRCEATPADRLRAFQAAKAAGSNHPNLLVWLAGAAAKDDDRDSARSYAAELLALVVASRATHGTKLDWPEEGRELFAKAEAVTGSRAEARELTAAISDHAFHKHWGHTVAGIVALRDGAVTEAVGHLRESAAMPGDFRLRAYGPSFMLAEELYASGEREAVGRYLEACAAFWDSDVLLCLRQQIANGRPVEFP